MPLVNATFAQPPSPEITRRTVQALTALTVEALGKELERTTVIVRYVPPGQWARGGVQSDLGGARRFVVEAQITAGTNSREEKAAFIREAHAQLAAILGEGAAGYVIVREIGADSWGYGGETQLRMGHVQAGPPEGQAHPHHRRRHRPGQGDRR